MDGQNQTFMERLSDTFLCSLANVLGVTAQRARKHEIHRVKINKRHSPLIIELATILNNRIEVLRSMGVGDHELKLRNEKYIAFIKRLSEYVREQRSGRAKRDTWLFYSGSIATAPVFELQETDVDSSVTNISVAVWL